MNHDLKESLLEPRSHSESKPILHFHPGWVILGVAAAGVYMSAPGQSFSVAAFVDPMLADLGMSRSQYSGAYLIATLIGGLTLPWIGRLLDAHGARHMLPTVALLLGLACLWMSTVRHLVALYIGFSLIRCLGQGCLTLISTWIVGEWFERRRGLAMGLVGAGGTFSVMTIPQINDFLIAYVGWRYAWIILAVAVWFVLILPGILLVRNRPEDLGLLPDGRWPSDSEPTEAYQINKVAQTESWTTRDACSTATFWKLMTVVCTCSLIGTGLMFHQVSLLGEQGVSRIDALRLLGLNAAIATVVSIIAGFLSDRIQARYLLVGSMLFLTTALILLMVMPSPIWAIAYSALLGMQGGIIRSTGMFVWIDYYGRMFQGAIRGVVTSIIVIAAALGPLPLALSKDHFGNYKPALGGFLLLPVLSTVCVLSASKPIRKIRAHPPSTSGLDTDTNG